LDLVKIYVRLNEKLVSKFIKVIFKQKENLKSLDLYIRVIALREKALKRAEKAEQFY